MSIPQVRIHGVNDVRLDAVEIPRIGADDVLVSEKVEIGQRELLGLEEEVVVEAPQEKVCTIRRRSGEEVIEVPIPCRN